MKELHAIIKRWNVSVADLARICEIPRQTVHRHLNGERTISLESARKYAKATRLPLWRFLKSSARGRKTRA